MHELLADLRYASRMLRKAPITNLVAVVSLGFAIATNTTAFSVCSAFLFETFRWRAPEEILFVLEQSRHDAAEIGVAPGNYLDWRESSSHLAGLEAFDVRPGNLTGGEEPERIDVVNATPGLFRLLGRSPILGRDFDASDTAAGSRAVVLTHPFFEHRFAGDPGVLGSSVSLDGVPHTVVGVLPRDFDFLPADVEVFRPIDLGPARHDRSDRRYSLLGRLAPGSRKEDVQAELAVVAERLEREFPEANQGYGVNVRTLREVFPGRVDTQLQYILMTVAVLVLVIASANLVNLYLARGDARRTELAVRRALGAGGARLGRQLLTESLLVAALGGILGILISFWWARSVASFMPALLPEVFHPKLDGLVLAYGVVVSLAAGALLGIAPALQAARTAPASALGDTSRGGSGSRRRRRLRASFIVAETAVALALLTAAGILTDTFERMVRENGSLEVEGLLTLELTADESRFPRDADVAAYYREVVRRLGELPRVESVAAMDSLPRSQGNPRTQFTLDGRPAPGRNEAPWAGLQSVSADYFETLGVPIVAGRPILPSDRAEGAPVVVVNESFVRTHLAAEEAIGRRVKIDGISREIVGVGADFLQSRIPGLESGAAVFLPFEQHPARSMSLAARVGGDPMALAEAARQAVWAVDPDQPIARVQTLEHHIETSLSGPIVLSRALTIMGVVALVLSAIGMYGLIAHDVSQRRREIGIKMALGAAPSRVVGSVVLRGLAITGLGMALGGPLAWAMERAIAAVFEGLAPLDLRSIGFLVLLLALVALVASSLPALYAARIRPARVLQVD